MLGSYVMRVSANDRNNIEHLIQIVDENSNYSISAYVALRYLWFGIVWNYGAADWDFEPEKTW